MRFKVEACLCPVILGVLVGCAGAKVIDPNGGGGGGGGGGGNGGTTGPTIDLDAKAPTPVTPVDPGAAPIACSNPTACTDFPTTPINDSKSPTAIPSNPGSQFSGSPSGSGPCVTEPEDGSLFPYNWTRPRIKWTGTSGLVQITVHADIEANDLVVYTTGNNWIMDKAIWEGLASHVHESDVSVTVRAASGGATTVKFQIASASAAGSIVFWAADPFGRGYSECDQRARRRDLASARIQRWRGRNRRDLEVLAGQAASREQSYNVRKPTCIGCHSATPDPGFVAFVDNWPWDSVIAGDQVRQRRGPSFPALTPGRTRSTQQTVGRRADLLEPQSGKPGSRMMVTTAAQQDDMKPWGSNGNDDWQAAKLVWYNLDSPSDPHHRSAKVPVATARTSSTASSTATATPILALPSRPGAMMARPSCTRPRSVRQPLSNLVVAKMAG
jgi:hypothetical protein